MRNRPMVITPQLGPFSGQQRTFPRSPLSGRMTVSGCSGSDAVRRRSLNYLFEEVVAAREGEESQSRGRVSSEGLYAARVRTLRALVDYAEMIESLGWPVPRVVHMDIVLRRSLCGPMAERLIRP